MRWLTSVLSIMTTIVALHAASDFSEKPHTGLVNVSAFWLRHNASVLILCNIALD